MERSLEKINKAPPLIPKNNPIDLLRVNFSFKKIAANNEILIGVVKMSRDA
jgi:hypothetical protein